MRVLTLFRFLVLGPAACRLAAEHAVRLGDHAPGLSQVGHELTSERPPQILRGGRVLREGLLKRRPLVLALALLGDPVSYDQAVPRRDDEVDTAAYLLSLVVCNPDRDRVSAGVKQVLVGATSREARRTPSEAERRIGAGVLLSLVG